MKKKRHFKFNKLIRDNVPEIIAKNPRITPVYKTLEDDEYARELLRKVAEEASELATASEEEFLSELADLQDIINHIKAEKGIADKEINDEIEKKHQKAGAFKKKIYLVSESFDEDDPYMLTHVAPDPRFEEILEENE